MDEADYAQQNEAQLIKMRIDRSRMLLNLPQADRRQETVECIDCEEIIPAARRKAVPGCARCVHCQEIHEGSIKR
jgi:phage/conjugal plasmid C-4 type zinc finger TraR family protein